MTVVIVTVVTVTVVTVTVVTVTVGTVTVVKFVTVVIATVALVRFFSSSQFEFLSFVTPQHLDNRPLSGQLFAILAMFFLKPSLTKVCFKT